LFASAGSPLPEEGIAIINMRAASGKEAAAALLGGAADGSEVTP